MPRKPKPKFTTLEQVLRHVLDDSEARAASQAEFETWIADNPDWDAKPDIGYDDYDRMLDAARETPDEGQMLRNARAPLPSLVVATIQNPNVTEAVLSAITEDDKGVSLALAKHPLCPDQQLERLAMSDWSDVRRAVLQRTEPDSEAYKVALEAELDLDPDFDVASIGQPSGEVEDGTDRSPTRSYMPDFFGRVSIAYMLFDPDPSQGKRYVAVQALPDAFDLQDEYHAEIAAVTLRRTPGFVLERVTAKLVPHIPCEATASSLDAQPTESGVGYLINLVKRAAEHPNATTRAIRALVKSHNREVLAIAARHPLIPKPAVKRLFAQQEYALVAMHASRYVNDFGKGLLEVKEIDSGALAVLASNPWVRDNTLKRLASWPEVEVVRTVASNPSLDKRTLTRLLAHEDAATRRAAASNPTTSWNAIRAKIEEGDPAVIAGAIAHPEADPKSVIPLLAEVDRDARLAAATCLDASPTVIGALANDPDPVVAHAATCNPATPPATLVTQFGTTGDARLQEAIAAHPNAPKELQHTIWNDCPHLHVHLAANPSLTEPLQRELAQHGDIKAWCALAANTSTSSAAIELLQEIAYETHYGSSEPLPLKRERRVRRLLHLVALHPNNKSEREATVFFSDIEEIVWARNRPGWHADLPA